jgi:hypothetical protein
VSLLKDKFVCVQEVITAQETQLENLAKERRAYLERFARNGRLFFGTIRVLSADGKEVLGELRSFPRSDEQTRKNDGAKFLALAQAVSKGQPVNAEPPANDPARKAGPPFLGGDPGLGLKRGGPKVGDKAPDFELKYLASDKTFKLRENFDKRPTVLIFHSFT